MGPLRPRSPDQDTATRSPDNRRAAFSVAFAMTWCAIALAIGAATPLTAQSGTPSKRRPIRLGVLFWHNAVNDATAFAGFRHGYEIARQPVTYDVRNAHEKRDAAAEHLAAFRNAGVDAVLALGTEATRMARGAVTDRPVIFTAVTNPVATGLVPNWNGSRRNLAGNSNFIDPDRIVTEVRRAFPKLRVLGALCLKGNAVSTNEIRGVEAALQKRASLGIRLAVRAAPSAAEIPAAAAALLDRVDALWIPIDYAVNARIKEIASLAARLRKPIVTTNPKATPQSVVSILCDYHTLGMQAAAIADRVLRGGTEPGALPVGRLKGRVLVLNIRAAREIDLVLPVKAMAAADRIIPAPRNAGTGAKR